ncbi:hypothetical protein J1TS1_26700 [Shouchella clausii]|uniref:Transporter n=1 Tax=Shouchella clausii TaxID=79880 RepID=A0A268NWB2_SHOCL|nr:hypothetical protein [Shouchella clausii]PAE87325.1 hypothetical protein CHH72_19280 [Shouchella clausii]GIN08525.1 hypothetical protein J1TS1_26700 [Shouchella clausii]
MYNGHDYPMRFSPGTFPFPPTQGGPPGPPPTQGGFFPGQGGPPTTSPGQGTGAPPGPPPSQAALSTLGAPSVFAVDPGAIAGCLFRYTFIRLNNGESFWFYPTFVGRRSVAGWRWFFFRWVFFGIDTERIASFQCV